MLCSSTDPPRDHQEVRILAREKELFHTVHTETTAGVEAKHPCDPDVI
jgi:hypothetical protein